MAVVVALLFTLGLTINFFRRELFGIVPGYAPHNFGFNAFFFIPFNFLLLLSSLFIILRTASLWTDSSAKKLKVQSLGLTLPIIALMLFQLLRILAYVAFPFSSQ
ncbi:MAG: hypothetical protein K0S09_3013 [Sphingobacteriaceae bacterium]|jgi:hypothetical protein|nr:hypothetical protein [Sphingobacteriaceae bacterium]